MKTALITGASSGVGADAARHLSARGYRVLLIARGSAALQRVAESIGGNAAVEVCDAASGEAVVALAERVRQRYGVPDVIVNCAGAGQWKLIEDTACEEALAMMQVPYLAAFNLSHAFMRDMLARRFGRDHPRQLAGVDLPLAFLRRLRGGALGAARTPHVPAPGPRRHRRDELPRGLRSHRQRLLRPQPRHRREDPLDLPHHTDPVHGRLRSA